LVQQVEKIMYRFVSSRWQTDRPRKSRSNAFSISVLLFHLSHMQLRFPDWLWTFME